MAWFSPFILGLILAVVIFVIILLYLYYRPRAHSAQSYVITDNAVDISEAEQIWQGKCPCGGQLLAGPKSGVSQNVKCPVCGNEYNVPPRPWLPQRIGTGGGNG